MIESLNNLETIREYLLGRISDEKQLEGIEELLFSDEDFCNKAEILEDELINHYVFGKLSREDVADFEKTLENNADRRLKVRVTGQIKAKVAVKTTAESVSILDSLKSFFRQPIYAGVLALLLIAALIGSVFLLRPRNSDELAGLKSIYQKERPIEPRIAGFDYAPVIVTRGETKDDANKNKLEEIKLELLKAVNSNPTAASFHALGVFNLTQQNYKEAIENLEKAAKLDDKNAAFQSDLGSAYFQSARIESNAKKLEILARALESYQTSLNLNPNSLDANFNIALCLQESKLYHQSKEAWLKYLEKDATSDWAEEARKNLVRLEELNKTSKTKEAVLQDFLSAFRNRDIEFSWQIIGQTRELVSEMWLPEQLSRRFLEGKLENDDGKARESIEALEFIGELEKNKNSDFFVSDMAKFYATIDSKYYPELLRAKDLMREGYRVSLQSENELAKQYFSQASRIRKTINDSTEEKLSIHWVAFSESNQGNINRSNELFLELEEFAERNNYNWLESVSQMRLSINFYLQNNPSKSLNYDLSSIKIAKEIADLAGQNVLYPDIAYSYFEMGEPQKALSFLSEFLSADASYFLSAKPKWTNLANISESLLWLKYRKAAVFFAEEHLQIATEQLKAEDNIISSIKLVAKIKGGATNQDEAKALIAKALKLNERISDDSTKKLNLAELNLISANISRLNGDCQKAILEYETAEKLYADFPEKKVRNYETQKGKLLCNGQLGETNKLKRDIPLVINLLEENRSQIVEEENRNLYFEKEQNIVDVAVDFELAENDPVGAFEYAETAKARSLLDFMQGNALVSADQTSFRSVTKNLNLNEIQSRMPENAQILEYAVLPEKVVTWSITKAGVKSLETKINSRDLEKKINDFVDSIVNEKDGLEKIGPQSSEIFDLLVKPSLALLDPTKAICIVPDKSLFRLPFAALFASETKKYLIEDFTLLYAPSSSIFVLASENAKRLESIKGETLLGIGNPTIDRAENPAVADLPSAASEVDEIAKFYPQNTKLIGDSATKVSALKELAGSNVFHFAGHYVTNQESSSNSKFLMAKSTDESDLRVFEIGEKRLTQSKLVVLSACDTGVERVFQGEGSIGVARIFLAIGSPAVVSGLWQVDTQATKDLMVAFHRNRKENQLSISESLRQAQIEMIKSENRTLSLPYYWSAFSQTGGIAN